MSVITGIWRAVTASRQAFALGAVEAWGFWTTTMLLLGTFIYLMEVAGGITWRLIEGRLHPKMRNREAEARYRLKIMELEARCYELQEENTRLDSKNEELSHVIEVNRNFARNWNAEAGTVLRGRAAIGGT